MIIQAIETHYNGYRFRSRLEARWAVFFDTLGIPYFYEHQGYTLFGGERYLPDFWIPHLNLFVEVKGPSPSIDEQGKAIGLCQGTGSTVMVVTNDCWYTAPMYLYHFNGDTQTGKGDMLYSHNCRWSICAACISFAISNRIKGKPYVYCFNGKCSHALVKANLEDQFQSFHKKEFPEMEDGWISFTGEVSKYLSAMMALKTAYAAARSARFEHGETPKVPRGKPKEK